MESGEKNGPVRNLYKRGGFCHDPDKEFFTMSLGEKLRPGLEYLLSLDYTAVLHTKDLKGFYRSNYTKKETGEAVYDTLVHFPNLLQLPTNAI